MQKKKLFFKKKGLNIKIWQKIQRKLLFLLLNHAATVFY